jgi:hypothetical protein
MVLYVNFFKTSLEMRRQNSGDVYRFSLCTIRNLMTAAGAISHHPTIR